MEGVKWMLAPTPQCLPPPPGADDAHDLLQRAKKAVENARNSSRSRRLDRALKAMHAYRFILPPDIVSRSYYKLVEMLHEFPDLVRRHAPLRTLHLCEAPGGFMQALVHYRMAHYEESVCDDRWTALTLPSPIIDPRAAQCGSGDVLYGDLCTTPPPPERHFHFITADGGFEIQPRQMNQQEKLLFPLINAEIHAIRRNLLVGGSCILKLYDTRSREVLSAVARLVSEFSTATLYKPRASRPQNSERYLVLEAFRGFECDGETNVDSLVAYQRQYEIRQAASLFEVVCAATDSGPINAPRERDERVRNFCQSYGLPPQ